MKKHSKRYREAEKLVDKSKTYTLQEAISILKKIPHVKFNETVDMSFSLFIDPKKSDQTVRGTLTLPHGRGKEVKIAVFCKGEAENFAKAAGADFVGAEDLVKKVESGWLGFDVAISTPEMMKELGRLGKILGPRGLMPSPKAGTVTMDVARAVKELKAGKLEFKMDKQSNIYCSIGKISFEEKALYENGMSLIEAILHAKPASLKGRFIKSASISTTMGLGFKLDISKLGLS